MRHRVHQQYRNHLMAVTCVVVLSMISLMLVMCSMIEVIAGLLLIGLIGVYFYFTQLRRAGRFRFEKGPCVGLLLGLSFQCQACWAEGIWLNRFRAFHW